MKIVSTFKHLEHTPALDQKIEEKSMKLKKYFDGNLEVFWTCSVKNDVDHQAEIKLLGSGFEFHATGNSDSLYKSLDLAISKVEKQVQKKKDKRRDKIHHKHDTPIREQLIAEGEKDEEFWEGREQESRVS